MPPSIPFEPLRPARAVRRRAGAPLAFVAALVLAGCNADATTEAPKPRIVQVQAVTMETVAERHAFTGVVRARHETPMAFRVAGKLQSRKVDVGARVAAGDVLAVLDPTDYRLALAAAEADQKSARAQVEQTAADEERARQLREKGFASQAQLDKVVAAARAAAEKLAAAESQRAIAANRLAYTTLTADADGVVTEVAAEPGQVVAEGRAVVTLARAGEREAAVAIPESRVAELAGADVKVAFWALAGRQFTAKLRELSPQADAATRSYAARFSLADVPPGIELGMTATIEVAQPAGEPRARLASTAIWYRGEQAMVWRASPEGRLAAVPVTVRGLAADAAIVAGGVATGDLVVTMGVHRLDEGTAVRVPASTRTAEAGR